jgi:hypothetical protein
MIRLRPVLLLLLAVLPTASLAQHFSQVYIDVRLVKPDSVRVTVEADLQDMMNTVYVFPYYADPSDSAYRAYERKMEEYLKVKLKLRADDKTVYMNAVAWKRGGKNRYDGLDSVSIQTGNHSFTMGGKIPADTKKLRVYSGIWEDREEVTFPPAMDYYFFEGDRLLRRTWSKMGAWVTFPILSDSLAAMRKLPPPHMPDRVPMDHSTHDD